MMLRLVPSVEPPPPRPSTLGRTLALVLGFAVGGFLVGQCAGCGDNTPADPPPTCAELGCEFALCTKPGPGATCTCRLSPDEDPMVCVPSAPEPKP